MRNSKRKKNIESLFEKYETKGGNKMRKRTIAALLACTMVLGTITGCSSEPEKS